MRTSACKTTLLLQLRILGLGFFQDEDVVLRRQPHPAQQVREPGIAVKPVKAWIDLQPNKPRRMILVSLFQPLECLSLVIQSGVDNCDFYWCDVPLVR